MDYQLPHNIEAEKAVLGSIILAPKMRFIVSTIISGDDFFLIKNKQVWEAVISLGNRGASIDPVTIDAELRSKYPAENWIQYLGELIQFTADEASASEYATIVQDKSTRRRMLRVAKQMSEAAIDETEDVEVQLGGTETALFGIRKHRNGATDVSPDDYSRQYLDEMERMMSDGRELAGLSTGFHDLDTLLNGLQAPHHYVIAGRPGMGKSSIIIDIADHVVSSGVKVALFSLEMSHKQLMSRRVSKHTGIPLDRILKPWLWTFDEQSAVQQAVGALSARPLYIDTTPGLTPTQLRARAMRLKAEHDIGLVVVDNLNCMQPDRSRSKENDVGDIALNLSMLYKTLGVPGITVAQLSRSSEYRHDKRPILADLRDSGTIEQEAYAAIFLYRDGYYDDDGVPGLKDAEIITAKNRDGSTGTISVWWDGAHTSYRNKVRGSSAPKRAVGKKATDAWS